MSSHQFQGWPKGFQRFPKITDSEEFEDKPRTCRLLIICISPYDSFKFFFLFRGLGQSLWPRWAIYLGRYRIYNTIQCNAMQRNATQRNAMQRNATQCNTIQYSTTLFHYASHTQQKLVSRWGIDKHVTIKTVYMY